MRSGKLDRRINIQTATINRDAFGQAISTWATTYTVWADVFPMPFNENFEGDRKTEQPLYKVRIRHIAGIIPSMRVLYNSVFYDIISINEGNRREYLDLIVQLDRNMT